MAEELPPNAGPEGMPEGMPEVDLSQIRVESLLLNVASELMSIGAGQLGMIPGMGGMKDMLAGADLDNDMNRLFGIINAMTPQERRNPTNIIDQSRRRRIATGAGVALNEVGDLVKQFDGMSAMMKGMAGLGLRDRMKEMQRIQGELTNPTGRLAKAKGDTGKRLTADQRRNQKKQRDKEDRRRRRDSRGS